MAEGPNLELPLIETSSFSVSFSGSAHQDSLDPHTGSVPRKRKEESLKDPSIAASYHDNDGAQNESGSQEDYQAQRLRSSETAYTESNSLPPRNLDFIQITSLMVNSMIGAGIFTVPGYILLLTRSKTVALVLWAIGGVYSSIW